jgi:hypothetical protein
VVLVLVLALGAGCSATPAARIAGGEALTTGNATYDEFFKSLRDVWSEAEAAQGDEQAAHAGLLKALGLLPMTPAAQALDESALRAKKLQEHGVLLHLEIAPDARLVGVHAKVDAADEAVLKSVEEAAHASLDVRKRLAALAARAATLDKRRVDLREQAADTFRAEGQAKLDEVIRELEAAQTALADATAKANLSAGTASRFVVELAQAVETGAGDGKWGAKAGRRPPTGPAAPPPPPVASAPAAPVAPVAPAPAPKPAAAPAPRPAAAPAPRPAAAPAPKKPKGGDDFEP